MRGGGAAHPGAPDSLEYLRHGPLAPRVGLRLRRVRIKAFERVVPFLLLLRGVIARHGARLRNAPGEGLPSAPAIDPTRGLGPTRRSLASACGLTGGLGAFLNSPERRGAIGMLRCNAWLVRAL